MGGLSLGGLLLDLLDFYVLVIFVYVILSWFPASGVVGDIRTFLASVCEPYIGLFRRIVPTLGGGGVGIDFSPLVAVLVLQLLIRPLVATLLRMAGL